MFDSLFSPVREENVYYTHNRSIDAFKRELNKCQIENGSVSTLAHQQILFQSLSCNGLREVRKDKVQSLRTQYFSASTKLLCWETIWQSAFIGR